MKVEERGFVLEQDLSSIITNNINDDKSLRKTQILKKRKERFFF